MRRYDASTGGVLPNSMTGRQYGQKSQEQQPNINTNNRSHRSRNSQGRAGRWRNVRNAAKSVKKNLKSFTKGMKKVNKKILPTHENLVLAVNKESKTKELSKEGEKK